MVSERYNSEANDDHPKAARTGGQRRHAYSRNHLCPTHVCCDHSRHWLTDHHWRPVQSPAQGPAMQANSFMLLLENSTTLGWPQQNRATEQISLTHNCMCTCNCQYTLKRSIQGSKRARYKQMKLVSANKPCDPGRIFKLTHVANGPLLK